MAALTIPEEYEAGLAHILSLSAESAESLISALQDASPAMTTDLLSEQISARVSIPLDDVEGIIGTLVALYVVRMRAEVPLAEFVDDVIEAIDESSVESLIIPDGKTDEFRTQLARLLEVKGVAITANVRAVLVDHEHDLCKAKILTDIRPVFEPGEETPIAAVIVHMLKLTYHQGSRLKDFYLALESTDLDELADIIERAKSQAKGLQSILKAAGVPYVNGE